MFSLVITIISIALIGVITIATVYSMDDVTGDSTKVIDYNAIKNVMYTINGGIDMQVIKKGYKPSTMNDLISNGYIKGEITAFEKFGGYAWELYRSGSAVYPSLRLNEQGRFVCKTINEKAHDGATCVVSTIAGGYADAYSETTLYTDDTVPLAATDQFYVRMGVE